MTGMLKSKGCRSLKAVVTDQMNHILMNFYNIEIGFLDEYKNVFVVEVNDFRYELQKYLCVLCAFPFFLIFKELQKGHLGLVESSESSNYSSKLL